MNISYTTKLQKSHQPMSLLVHSPISVNSETAFEFDKVVLLSDTYVSSSVYSNAVFANVDTVTFRNIQTGENVKNGDHLDRSSNEPLATSITKSHKLNLLKKGSVFYCNPNETKPLTNELNNLNFRTIGYNHYVIIPKKS